MLVARRSWFRFVLDCGHLAPRKVGKKGLKNTPSPRTELVEVFDRAGD